jgi:hypothetical protein
VIVVGQPGAIVGRKEDERILGNAELVEGVEDASHRPVDLFDGVAVHAAAANTFELLRAK